MLQDEYDILHTLVEEICEIPTDEKSESSLFRGPSFGVRYTLKDPYLFDEEEK